MRRDRLVGGAVVFVAETMIPEAFAETRDFSGIVVVAGFLVAFALSHASD